VGSTRIPVGRRTPRSAAVRRASRDLVTKHLPAGVVQSPLSNVRRF
jgi:hypothetical protein